MTDQETPEPEPEKTRVSPLGFVLSFVGVLARTLMSKWVSPDGYVHTEPATRAEARRGPIIWSPVAEDSAHYSKRRIHEERNVERLTGRRTAET